VTEPAKIQICWLMADCNEWCISASRMKAEYELEWVWKSVRYQICKKLSESDNIQIRIWTSSHPY